MSTPPTTYVTFNIANKTDYWNDDQIYLFLTQESINLAWQVDPATGIAVPMSEPGVLAPSCTLADLGNGQGEFRPIQIDASTTIPSARIYFSNSPAAVSVSAAGFISGPTAGTAQFYYDFIEFALTDTQGSGQPNNLNIDTTQVDQLGYPITLQVTPNDPNFPAGSGIMAKVVRSQLINDFASMATGNLAAFADCVIPGATTNDPAYRLLNPSDVIGSQLAATFLQGTIATSGSAGNWQATFTITGPGTPAPTNASLAVEMNVSGGLIPAGTTIADLPAWPTGNTAVMTSSATANPFTASSTAVPLYFFNPPTTALATYFDAAIDAFFTYWKASTTPLQIEQNNSGDFTYDGVVTQVTGTDINGNTSTYTVLQFTGGKSETYNLYYPFFSTNSPAGKQSPFGVSVPPPPAWWAPAQGLMWYAPPSLMVFGASGVFADNTQQNPPAPNSAAVLGAIENFVVTALARGCATTLQFKEGTISPTTPGANTATVALSSGTNTSGLPNGGYMSSFEIANIPMTAEIPSGSPVTSFTVTSPLPIEPTAPDLLTFSEFYPAGGTWSAFASFLHNGAGYDITIDGRAYALPFDDQGGFSSDLNAASSVTTPAAVSITLGPWSDAL